MGSAGWMLLLSLLGCPAPEGAPDGDTAGTDTGDTDAAPCDDDAPVETPLAWDEVGAGGVSAADLFSFGIGTFTASLAWDDAITATFTLEVSPIDATESVDADTTRYCVRASLDAASLECRDLDDTTGAE